MYYKKKSKKKKKTRFYMPEIICIQNPNAEAAKTFPSLRDLRQWQRESKSPS